MLKLPYKKLIELLKSGNFTIVYWDSCEPTLYKGKWDYNEEYDNDDYETMNKSQIELSLYNANGYLPDIVALLSEALGGKTDSI